MKLKLLFSIAMVCSLQFMAIHVKAQESANNAYLYQRSLISGENAHMLAVERINSYISQVFSNPGDWAQVIVECKAEYNLRFFSNNDSLPNFSHDTPNKSKLDRNKALKDCFLAQIEKEPLTKRYYLWMRAGKKYKGRSITINVRTDDFIENTNIYLSELAPKSSVSYRLYDTASENDGSAFQEHYVKAYNYMRQCNYHTAKLEFSLALYCRDGSDVVKDHVRKRINDCDSIMTLSKEAERLVDQNRYADASDVFLRALIYNGNDSYLFARYQYCNRMKYSRDILYFSEADNKFEEKDYEAAASLYQEVVNQNGEHKDEAMQRLELCKLLSRREKNTERYIGIEFGLGSPSLIGFTRGSFSHKVDYYFTAKLTQNIGKLIRKNYNMQDHALLEITPFGMTFPLARSEGKIFKGIWMNLGLGASGSSYYSYKDSELQSPELDDSKNINVNFDLSIMPEGGIMLKIWRVGLKANFQYRLPVTTKNLDYINKSQFSLGVGYFF